MVPGVVTFVPLFVLISNIGLTNTLPGLILPFLAGPFGVFLMRQFILGLPDELIEAARIDGAGELRIFFSVILPLCGPAARDAGRSSRSWLAGTTSSGRWWSPRPRTSTPCRSPWRSTPSARTPRKYGLLLAGSVVVVVPVLIVFLVLQRHIMQGIAMTGIK